MTQSQERAINKIKRASIWMDGLEIKRFDVEDFIGFVSLYIEVGNIGDDDTLASIICRDRVHVFIGKRGVSHILYTRNSKTVVINILKRNINHFSQQHLTRDDLCK